MRVTILSALFMSAAIRVYAAPLAIRDSAPVCTMPSMADMEDYSCAVWPESQLCARLQNSHSQNNTASAGKEKRRFNFHTATKVVHEGTEAGNDLLGFLGNVCTLAGGCGAQPSSTTSASDPSSTIAARDATAPRCTLRQVSTTACNMYPNSSLCTHLQEQATKEANASSISRRGFISFLFGAVKDVFEGAKDVVEGAASDVIGQAVGSAGGSDASS